MLRETLEDIGRSPSARVRTLKTELHIMESCHLLVRRHQFEDVMATYHSRSIPDRCPSAEKHVRMVLAMEAREGLNTRNQAGRLIAESGHLIKDMMATYDPPGIAGEVAENHPTLSARPTTVRRSLGARLGFQHHRQVPPYVLLVLSRFDETVLMLQHWATLGPIFFPAFMAGFIRFCGILAVEECPPGGELCCMYFEQFAPCSFP